MTDTTQTTTPRTCECGCGATVARRFLPGHDARLKGALKRQALSRCGLVREPAIRKMVELGWGKYLPIEVVASLPTRSRGTNGRFVRTVHIAQVEFEAEGIIDEAGFTHAHAECTEIQGDTTPDPTTSGWTCGTCTHTVDVVHEVFSR